MCRSEAVVGHDNGASHTIPVSSSMHSSICQEMFQAQRAFLASLPEARCGAYVCGVVCSEVLCYLILLAGVAAAVMKSQERMHPNRCDLIH